MARYYEEHADEMEKLRAEIEKAKAVEKKDAVDERLILKKLNRDYRDAMKQERHERKLIAKMEKA